MGSFISKGKFKKTCGNDIFCRAWGIDRILFNFVRIVYAGFSCFAGLVWVLGRGYEPLVFC
jgi:hypothetical protein